MNARMILPALLLAAATAPALASGPSVSGAWIRAVPAGTDTTAGYMRLHNPSDRPLALIGASSPAFGLVELRKSVFSNGAGRVIPQARVVVPAHGRLDFAPGGYHLILQQPGHALHAGDDVAVTLRFYGGRTLRTTFRVRPAPGREPMPRAPAP
jgi:periplasmic copper chaperone A